MQTAPASVAAIVAIWLPLAVFAQTTEKPAGSVRISGRLVFPDGTPVSYGVRMTPLDSDGRADLREANLSWADLRNADLREANLSWADLRNADLREANLSWANLSWANLRNADLSDADLRGADLRNADLSDADLRGADLRNADLRDAGLSGADLHGTQGIIARVWRTNDPYEFIAVRQGQGYRIKAGCRWFTDTEFRDHVAAEYPHTPKAEETLAILDFIAARAAA